MKHATPRSRTSSLSLLNRSTLALAASTTLLAGCAGSMRPMPEPKAADTAAAPAIPVAQEMAAPPVAVAPAVASAVAPAVASAVAPAPAPAAVNGYISAAAPMRKQVQVSASRNRNHAGSPANSMDMLMSAPAVAHQGTTFHFFRQEANRFSEKGANKFPEKEVNKMRLVADEPLSTFSVDVDTASYAFVRRMLASGNMPQQDAVRVEEMVNYFPYTYAAPASRKEPFAVTTALMPNPWKADTQLVHIGVRGFDIQAAERPRANIVLLIDVSGSMTGEDRLPLLKKSFAMFADKLRADDRVAIVTYAGGTGVVLEPTPGSQKDKIIDAINALRPGGGTAGAAGLQRAYELAERNFDPKAVNRVIIGTDGDFNVGLSDNRSLEQYITTKRKTGVYLSVLGVGEGNLNDGLMQRLAQAGNGNAAYIDNVMEARKVLGTELGSTMFPIANDVKVQVEFNPAQVASYRLVGYETRMLEKQDFNNDKIDAGDMGAGHTVTAIYEITPARNAAQVVDPLRYQSAPAKGKPAAQYGPDEVCLVKVRYKLPGESISHLTQQVVKASAAYKSMSAVPDDQRFAVAVAAFGQRLRGESQLDGLGFNAIAEMANGARGADPEGYRAEFVKLVRTAEVMGKVRQAGQP